jgi:NAD(P)-dependent dehydrogenase (short-subunit alcohol dehydrogenase family)
MAVYNAVKAGVVALTETLHHELAPYGVAASVVCPSFFRTNLSASLKGADADVVEKAAALIESSPRSAAEVADAVVEGIERREELILPDEGARSSYSLKLTDRAAYEAEMQVTARRAKEREQAQEVGDAR